MNHPRGREFLRPTGMLILATLIFCTVFAAHSFGASADQELLNAARGVLERTAGRALPDVRLARIPPDSGRDVYEVAASGGKLTIKGSSAIAMTRGFYHYLRDACSMQVTWSLPPQRLPSRLPAMPLTRVVSPYTFRQYFNVCTLGYTTTWWDWSRWERELDWMALHGINMPLAMVGQEAIWQKVWRARGLTDAEIADYFTGPAFLPWHRMGNINNHGGPLPQGWIDAQKTLQKKILARMRELGMDPVVPAFAGFVPRPFGRTTPGARIFPVPPWAGFSPACQTFLLDPASPFFVEIGKSFIQEYTKEFGAARYYLADSFNELQVPVSREHRYDELASFGKAVYSSINAGNPAGIWVMQGWLFFNDAAFWDTASAAALIRDVPDDRMIILDLANEMFHGWKVHKGFYGKRWIYSVINNFGGNNPLNGNLKFLATDPAEALASPLHGRLAGSGLAPEGVENNEVVYELATDMQWRMAPADLNSWIRAYCITRYGTCPPAVEQAWKEFLLSAYSRSYTNIRHAFQERPSMTPRGNVDDGERFAAGLSLMLSCSEELGGSPGYRNDIVEMAVQVAGGAVDSLLRSACHAHEQGTPGLRDSLARQALSLLQRIDALLAWRPDMRLERWLSNARTWGATGTEEDFYEENARRQITIWGGPDLYDYAAKVWSGLVRDFYAGRWKFFLEKLAGLQEGERVTEEEQIAWEEQWIRARGVSPSEPVVDPVGAAKELAAAAHSLVGFAAEPEILPLRRTWSADAALTVSIIVPSGSEVHYTTDGSEPDAGSQVYRAPFTISAVTTVRARAFHPGVRPGFVSRALFTPVRQGVNGLHYRYVEGEWDALPDFDTLHAVREGVAYTADLGDIPARADHWGVRLEGMLEIPHDGDYTLSVVSDDGSKLWVDGRLVVDNDGNHPPRERSGSLHLGAGRHPLVLGMYETIGAQKLEVYVEGPGVRRRPLPPSWLFLR